MSIISKELSDAIDIPLDMAAKVRCDDQPDGERNCIDPQLKPRAGKRIGWHQADPRKMCAGCACYWHLSCARNFALGVVR